MSAAETLQTGCCIVGGGPAGMMAGFLLARAGVEVVVLEKHADFFRDFRGDTIHPSTLELMHELGFLDDFLKLPHQQLAQMQMNIAGSAITVADFSHLPTRCQFIAFMPQWDFLSFLAEKAKAYPSFRLLMGAEAVDLVRTGERITGVSYKTAQGSAEIRANLVIAADGRGSTLRERAGLSVQDFNVPIDVLWMRLAKVPHAPAQSLGFAERGRFMILLDRGDYFQGGYIIRKGTLDALRQEGLPAFRARLTALAPFLRESAEGLTDWNQVKLLTVKIDRLRRWHLPGLLCIGDSAHAMSPAGGVGINLAIQDAVATANLLAPAFTLGEIDEGLLRQIQRRREFPARVIQALQVFIHRRTFPATPRPPAPPRTGGGTPLPAKIFGAFPLLRRGIARLIGLGVRPEHIRSQAAGA
jgi:2-polyprenyl-6-methoxyphenol hydroxylase-like FAD-dependent oxidoreductase